MRKLPIGIQSFSTLIQQGCVYVDKTEFVYRLAHENGLYFLSRPPRFGKSLLVSTLKAYWEGRKELFSGLKAAELEPGDWKRHPVFCFSFKGNSYTEKGSLEAALDTHLRCWEAEYHLSTTAASLGERFQKLLMEANRQTGQRSVVLVDDYDKTLRDAIDMPELLEHNKAVFKGFFSALKASDEYLRFVLITGTTIFDRTSVFSDLNQLRDISMAEDYAGLCGFTEKEIADNFGLEIEGFSKGQRTLVAGCREQLRKAYGGYLFHHQGPKVCNPGSLLCALSDSIIGAKQCISASMIKKILEIGFDVQKAADNSLYATEAILSDYRPDCGDLIPLLYQLGYLSIKGYDSKRRRYTLGFANEEAARAVMGSMMPANT